MITDCDNFIIPGPRASSYLMAAAAWMLEEVCAAPDTASLSSCWIDDQRFLKKVMSLASCLPLTGTILTMKSFIATKLNMLTNIVVWLLS